MRKMMNKKGFSLVELMIVVVIMGILIAVAIPLYGAITDNANAKTCANNIKVIKNTCANYFSSNDQTPMPDDDTLASMMEAKVIPSCPLDNDTGDGDKDGYKIGVNLTTGVATVYCNNYDGHGDKKATIGSVDAADKIAAAAKSDSNEGMAVIQEAGTTK